MGWTILFKKSVATAILLIEGRHIIYHWKEEIKTNSTMYIYLRFVAIIFTWRRDLCGCTTLFLKLLAAIGKIWALYHPILSIQYLKILTRNFLLRKIYHTRILTLQMCSIQVGLANLWSTRPAMYIWWVKGYFTHFSENELDFHVICTNICI